MPHARLGSLQKLFFGSRENTAAIKSTTPSAYSKVQGTLAGPWGTSNERFLVLVSCQRNPKTRRPKSRRNATVCPHAGGENNGGILSRGSRRIAMKPQKNVQYQPVLSEVEVLPFIWIYDTE